MRFARVTVAAGEYWGVVREDGDDGVDTVHLIDGPPFGEYTETGESVRLADTVLRAPATPSKVMCLGRNYDAHAAEMGYVANGEPSVWMKPPTALLDPGGAVVLPPPSLSTTVQHEAELAVIISRPARNVRPDDALDHVLGYTCADDVSARDLQRSDPQITRAKGFDTFCPLGPWIETDLDPAADVSIRCSVNGQARQAGSTTEMIYDVPFLISYISQFATLLPGDLLLTGSPSGSGDLVDGDVVDIEIDGVGTLRHTVVAAEASTGG